MESPKSDIKEDKELVDKMIGVAKPNSRFDAIVNKTTTYFVLKIIVPLIENLFNKYSEEYFHKKMTDGFDFIQDMEQNHTREYHIFIKSFRKLRKKLNVNASTMYNIIIEITVKKGWKLTDYEKMQVAVSINNLMEFIYS